ncbi:MAG: hypothetical protein WCF63_01765 [Acidimicrobiales bacterium]
MQNVVVVVGGGFVVVVVGGGFVVVVVGGGFVVVVVVEGGGIVVVAAVDGFVVVVVVVAGFVVVVDDEEFVVVVVGELDAGGEVVDVALDAGGEVVAVVVDERVVVVPEADAADGDEDATVVVGSELPLGLCATCELELEAALTAGWACIKARPPAAVVPSATEPATMATWDVAATTLPRLLN